MSISSEHKPLGKQVTGSLHTVSKVRAPGQCPVGSKHSFWATLEWFFTPICYCEDSRAHQMCEQEEGSRYKAVSDSGLFAYRRAVFLAGIDLLTTSNQSGSSPLTRGGINLI